MKLDERYFPGGYNPEHPTGNVQFRLEDNEDGTGTLYEFDEDGELVLEEARTDLEIPAPTHNIVELLSQLSPEEFQRVLMLGVAITHPESVWALEYAVVAEDPLAGIEVVRDAAVTALEMSQAGE